MTGRLQTLAGVSTPGRVGGGARKIRVPLSGTKEIVGGAGVSIANGVPPESGCLTARSPCLTNKKEGDYQSSDFLVDLLLYVEKSAF